FSASLQHPHAIAVHRRSAKLLHQAVIDHRPYGGSDYRKQLRHFGQIDAIAVFHLKCTSIEAVDIVGQAFGISLPISQPVINRSTVFVTRKRQLEYGKQKKPFLVLPYVIAVGRRDVEQHFYLDGQKRRKIGNAHYDATGTRYSTFYGRSLFI